MKHFKYLTLAFGLTSAVALGACGNDALGEANKLADELCACKDAECVEKVTAKGKKTMSKDEMEKLAKDKPEEVAKLTEKIMKCSMKHLQMPDMPAAE